MMQTQTVSELKDFVKKLNSLPEMTVSDSLNYFQNIRVRFFFLGNKFQNLTCLFCFFLCQEAHKSCSTSVHIYIQTIISWPSRYGAHYCGIRKLRYVSYLYFCHSSLAYLVNVCESVLLKIGDDIGLSCFRGQGE